VAAILASTGIDPLGDAGDVVWQGTPGLTSRAKRVAGERLFVIGDAAGYVEPFTGEGIAWAIDGALAAAPLAAQASQAWRPSLAATWEQTYRRCVRRRQLACHALSAVLRRPWAVALAFGLVRGCPAAAERMICCLSQPDGALPT
jgi:flavin-dependent dehydrogenase